jgi:hypothetical protein
VPISRAGLADPTFSRAAGGPCRALYVAADLFVLASRFEGSGTARGRRWRTACVIGTTAARFRTVPPNAGVLVELTTSSADPHAANADRNPERQWLASGAREAGAALPTWEGPPSVWPTIEALGVSVPPGWGCANLTIFVRATPP